jgi:H+/Cl- antiporter ClcA
VFRLKSEYICTNTFCTHMMPIKPLQSPSWHPLTDRKIWHTRLVVMAFAALSGLGVVALTWLSEHALSMFHGGRAYFVWAPLIWTPLVAAVAAWITRRWAPGLAGSGIPQVLAALDHRTSPENASLYVSFKLACGKTLLTAWGLLGGLSLGREGPSVQIGAGIMHMARHALPFGAAVNNHGLLTAGGAAGIAAAFNTPLGGIMFAIEELSKRPEQRSTGLIMAAIVLSGLLGVSFFGNANYFGIIRTLPLDASMLLPGTLIALACGAGGGLFARLLVSSLSETSPDRWTRWRQSHPITFAGGCGLGVAIIGLVSHGATFGSGYVQTQNLLNHGDADHSSVHTLLKFIATWLTAWAGIPGGIFAPALAIGASLGADIAHVTSHANAGALIAMGMVGFLAAVTQTPMTAFIIVMEMVDGHNMVLSLMAVSVVSASVSRLISKPLYAELACLQLKRLPLDIDTPKRDVTP